MYKINGIEHLKIIHRRDNWCPRGYTERKFQVSSIEEIKYLINNYHNNFAFGFIFNNKDYSLIKENSEIYFRNNNNYIFKYPKDPDILNKTHDIKTQNIDEIINSILQNVMVVLEDKR